MSVPHDPALIEEARRRWDQGARARKIAADMGLTVGMVTGIARRHNFTARANPIKNRKTKWQKQDERMAGNLPPERRRQIEAMLKGGKSAKEIASTVKCRAGVVRNIRNQLGIKPYHPSGGVARTDNRVRAGDTAPVVRVRNAKPVAVENEAPRPVKIDPRELLQRISEEEAVTGTARILREVLGGRNAEAKIDSEIIDIAKRGGMITYALRTSPDPTNVNRAVRDATQRVRVVLGLLRTGALPYPV